MTDKFNTRQTARQMDSLRRREKRDLDRRRAAREAELAADQASITKPSQTLDQEGRQVLREVDDPVRRARHFDNSTTDPDRLLEKPLVDGESVSDDVLGPGGEWDTRDIVRDMPDIDADPRGLDVVDTPPVDEFGGEF